MILSDSRYAPFPHADFIRAIKIALQRWGIDSGEPRRHKPLYPDASIGASGIHDVFYFHRGYL
nr:MAG TPA: Protein of unknown function (DUF3288) [Caudoviricetes sp.]